MFPSFKLFSLQQCEQPVYQLEKFEIFIRSKHVPSGSDFDREFGSTTLYIKNYYRTTLLLLTTIFFFLHFLVRERIFRSGLQSSWTEQTQAS